MVINNTGGLLLASTYIYNHVASYTSLVKATLQCTDIINDILYAKFQTTYMATYT